MTATLSLLSGGEEMNKSKNCGDKTWIQHAPNSNWTLQNTPKGVAFSVGEDYNFPGRWSIRILATRRYMTVGSWFSSVEDAMKEAGTWYDMLRGPTPEPRTEQPAASLLDNSFFRLEEFRIEGKTWKFKDEGYRSGWYLVEAEEGGKVRIYQVGNGTWAWTLETSKVSASSVCYDKDFMPVVRTAQKVWEALG